MTTSQPATSEPATPETAEPGLAPPEITALDNGPFELTGDVPVVRRRPVETEHGEPIAWSNGKPVDTGEPGEPAYLCRCGHSANKPFCDGSHNTAGVSLADGDDLGSYAELAEELTGPGVVVRDNRALCSSAGFCSNQLTNVWDMVSGAAATDVRSQLLAMIERCPSGALTYSIDGAGEVEPRLPVEVTVQRDGPLVVTGRVRVRRADGTELETRNRVALCRCGESKTKPLCDGSHKEAAFRDG